MSEQTNIAWCDSTINFWSGCTMVKVNGGLKDSGCLHCYAKTRDDRHMIEKVSHWGAGAPRLKHVGAVKQALALNCKPWICDACGAASLTPNKEQDDPFCTSCNSIEPSYHRRRIFSLSLGDWLDDEVPIQWLAEMLDTIRQCDQVVWILCTKRPENWLRRMQEVQKCGDREDGLSSSGPVKAFGHAFAHDWIRGIAPKNVILLTSVENQAMADLRIPQLLAIPAACHGLSLEPLLDAVDLSKWVEVLCEACGDSKGAHHMVGQEHTFEPEPYKLSWLIIGGESGAGARPCNVEWICSLVEQGKAAGVAMFVKQLGANPVFEPVYADVLGRTSRCEVVIRDKKGGDKSEWPQDLRIQQFPTL